MDADYAIVGGGVVGLSIAWGLLKRGHTVHILDGDDGSYRASRGNFGLVWVQSKGLDQPEYARWSQRSAKQWPQFASELFEATGADLSLEQSGGYDFHLDEQSLERKVAQYNKLKEALGGDYPFDVLGHNALKTEEASIGNKVVGAILHHQDGHVNPLTLLRALSADVRRLGGKVLVGSEVVNITKGEGFTLTCTNGTQHHSQKVVLSAGLGALSLAPQLGLAAPVRPQRGQVLITEKIPKLLNRPSGIIRQVNEGGIQIGDSKEEVGFDDSVTLDTIAKIAARAITIFPSLQRTKMVRSWGALRIMSPDGLPIYQQSQTMPGAYLVTCHSGITLAAAHARFLPDWLENNENAPNLEVFSEKRFTI